MSSSTALPMRVLLRLWRTLRLTSDEFRGDRCFDKSAGLAYVSLLGVFAVVAVVMSVAAILFQASGERVEQIETFIFGQFLPVEARQTQAPPLLWLEQDPALPPASLEEHEQHQARLEEMEQQEAAYARAVNQQADVREAVGVLFSGLIRQFQGYRDNAVGIGALGIIGLVVVSMMLFTQIERGFNEVFHVRRKRPLWTAFTTYFAVLVIVPLGIGYSLSLSLQVSDRIPWLSPRTSALVITCLLFTVAFWRIPNTRVSLMSAAVGGIVAGALWEFAKAAFIFYITRVPSMESFVRTLGIIPTFLIWLYTTWLVVFVGLELCYVLQHYSPLADRIFQPAASLELNPRYLLSALHELTLRFEGGKPHTSVTDLMKATQLDEYSVHALLDHCEQRGWVAASVPHASYHLARPPEQIALRDILLRPMTHVVDIHDTGATSPLAEFWRRYHMAADGALPAQTLRDLIARETSSADRKSGADAT